MMRKTVLASLAAGSVLTVVALAQDPIRRPAPQPEEKSRYELLVESVNKLVSDRAAQDTARRFGLNFVPVAWEDNGRTKGSVWGPLISDYSIYVHIKDAQGKFKKAETVPLLRNPNFADKTADQPPSKFFIKTGNQTRNGRPELINLAEYLANLNRYLTSAGRWNRSLLSARDTDFVVSAQASFIPLAEGENAVADFTPTIYQYQSNDIQDGKLVDRAGKPLMKKNPAVLVILATREGTAATIIDNKRDALEGQRTHGQPLFYNLAGLRAPFQAKRKSDFVQGGGNPAETGVGANGETGLGMVLMIQVPLVHVEQRHRFGYGIGLEKAMPMAAAAGAHREEAVIGHGAPVGPFTELAGLDIRRDERYPIRVTVQFYQAVQSADLRDEDYRAMQKQINSIYAKADAVGSLVIEGETGRVTEHSGPRWYPPRWWRPWWHQFSRERLGLSEEEGVRKLEQVYGKNGWKYLVGSETEVRAAIVEAQIKLGERPETDRPKNEIEQQIEKEKNK